MRARENLLTAIMSNHPEAVARLITQIDYTKENENKETPMELACKQGHWECVEAIAKIKKTDSTDTAKYSYALIHAVNEKRLDTAKILLEAGALRNWHFAKNKLSYLHIAIQNDHIPMIELLLSYNCAINIRDYKQRTPMQYCYELGHWDCMEAIAKNKKTDIEDTATYGFVLALAVKKDRLTTAKILLEAGASPNLYEAKNEDNRHGDLCLHHAVRNDNEQMVTLLLTFGAELEAKNSASQTARELATKLDTTCFQNGWKRYYNAECFKIITTLILFIQASRQPASKLYNIPDYCLELILPFLSRESIEPLDAMPVKRNSLARVSTQCFLNRHSKFKNPPSAAKKLVSDLNIALQINTDITENVNKSVNTFLEKNNNKKLRTYRFLNRYKLINLYERENKERKEKEQKQFFRK